LVAFWVLGTNTAFPYDPSFPNDWQSNVLAAVNNGLSAWVAYRFSGNYEVYKYFDYAIRIWVGRPCGGTNIACDKGRSLRNVMMFDEANTSSDGLFPFSSPSTLSNADGPVGVQTAAFYIAAILYDIANEAGLGVYKADQLIWKSISLITNNTYYPMRSFGATIQEAARALWPDLRTGREGLSLYEEDIADVLTSRGIPLNGVADFRTNLPPAIGPVGTADARNFGSAHPNPQASVNSYGLVSANRNSYTTTNASSGYMAFQFYKHSKLGPCDELQLTDGTFAADGSYNHDGTYYWAATDRVLENLVLLVPGSTIRWRNMRKRCDNEASGFYAEDVQAFGFIATKATPNGFSFTASTLADTEIFKTYQLTIVDPSANTIGAATYAWSFIDYLGNTNTVSGTTVQYSALKDQPFTISIDRTRAGQTDTLTLRERGNDLDRNGGSAFVKNLVP
jgi:hypothetical protein